MAKRHHESDDDDDEDDDDDFEGDIVVAKPNVYKRIATVFSTRPVPAPGNQVNVLVFNCTFPVTITGFIWDISTEGAPDFAAGVSQHIFWVVVIVRDGEAIGTMNLTLTEGFDIYEPTPRVLFSGVSSHSKATLTYTDPDFTLTVPEVVSVLSTTSMTIGTQSGTITFDPTCTLNPPSSTPAINFNASTFVAAPESLMVANITTPTFDVFNPNETTPVTHSTTQTVHRTKGKTNTKRKLQNGDALYLCWMVTNEADTAPASAIFGTIQFFLLS